MSAGDELAVAAVRWLESDDLTVLLRECSILAGD